MPLTLHAAWLRSDEPVVDGKLFFWAETLDFQPNTRTESATANGGGRRSSKPASHPGQLPINQIRNLLDEEVGGLPLAEMQPASATVWLPSRDQMPLARRSVVQASHDANVRTMAPVQLSNWQVTGLASAPLPALIFLSQVRQQNPNRTGLSVRRIERLRFGNDLLYWSNVAKFALELLIGQSYVPAMRINGSAAIYALWQPMLIDDRIKRQFSALTDTMPPVCRAYNLERTADAIGAHALTEHFVAAMVDVAVRTWANGRTSGAPPATPSLQWVNQLRAPSRTFVLPPQPAYRLVQDWQSWIEQLHITSDANFRITFELVEPDVSAQSGGYTGALGDNGVDTPPVRSQWALHYFLQARDDLRLLIPADQVWGALNGALRFGNRRVDRPQERLLAGLGAASRLFPPIERSLRSARPEYALLSADEAHRFLCETAPLLESNGFGVLLPDWWNSRQRTRLGLRLRLLSDDSEVWNTADDAAVDTPVRRRAGHPRPIRYVWELTLGAERISQEEFERLAALNVPLLKMRNQWIELDPAQVEAAKQFLAERQTAGEMSLLQSIRMAQAYVEETNAQHTLNALQGEREALALPPAGGQLAAALPLEAVDVDGWLSNVLDLLRTQRMVGELGEPEGFVGELRPYQRRGVGWLAYLRRLGLGACLADDMGLGKTIQAIAMLLHERKADDTLRPALLVCPTSVVANWRREVERFAPGMRILVHHGGSRLEGGSFLDALRAHDLVLTSYGTARRDIEVLQSVEWSDLILDEAQNIKNSAAKQSQAVRKLKAHNRVALTGTPVENHLTELWSVLEFLNPGYLGSHERFRQQFTVPIERYNDDEQAIELRRLVQPFLLRRLKSDPTIISDLPEKNEMVVYCSLTQEQASLYETTVHDALAMLDRADGIQRRGLVLSLLTKLKQICNHPAHYLKQGDPLGGRSGKLDRLTEMLEEALSVGDHALIFTQFVEMGTLLQRHLRERLNTEVLFLHGGTPAAQRDQMVQAFQDEDGPAIFVLSLRAGGSGLNLTRANHVFHFDRWWNPAVENQATDRAFRIGQLRNVQVHKYVVAGTLEERIHEIIESKQALAESIVGSGENWLAELGTDELRELLTLRREMLED